MFVTVTQSLLMGFFATLKLFVLTLVFALPLGLFICFGSMNRFAVIRLPIRLLIWIIRGTPLLLQLLVIYYGPGIMGYNVWGSREFVINYACYFLFFFCGGIQSIPIGQYEAGKVLGMKNGQIFRRIILLQLIKRIVPPISNEIITLVKDTSLARVIAVYEIIWNGQAFIKSHGIIWPLFYTGVFYLLFSGLLTLLFGYIEKRLSYFR